MSKTANLAKALQDCLDVRNTVRALRGANIAMERLAINGTIRAVKLPEGEGQVLSVLTSELGRLPQHMSNEIELLRKLCDGLAEAITASAQQERRQAHFQHVCSRLKHVEPGEPTLRHVNRKFIARRHALQARAGILKFRGVFGMFRKIRRRLCCLRRVGRTAEYVGSMVGVEAVRLDGRSSGFTTVAKTTQEIATQMLETLREVADTLIEGEARVKQFLLCKAPLGGDSAKSSHLRIR